MKTLLLHHKIIKDSKYGVLDERNAKLLAMSISVYKTKIKELGVSVPKIFDVNISKDKSDKWIVSITEDFFPTTIDKFIKNCNPQDFQEAVKQILIILSSIIIKGQGKIGIDPKPENFSILKKKVIYYDFVPPLINDKNSLIFLKRTDEQKQKTSWKVKRYFTAEGILQTFLLRFMPYQPQLENILRENILQEISDLPNEIKKPLKKGKFYAILCSNLWKVKDVKDLNKVTEFVQKSKKSERDLLRMLFLLSKFNRIQKRLPESDDIFAIYKKYKSPIVFKEMKSFVAKSLQNAFK